MALVKKGNTKDDAFNIAVMVQHLERIYSNKSGDEYKMHGDITKSPSYDLIQRTVADLDTIKGLSKTDIKDLKDMFNILHRPNFKSVITKWMGDKNGKYISSYLATVIESGLRYYFPGEYTSKHQF